MNIAPELAQMTINFLNRVPTTGIEEASNLLACVHKLKEAGEAGAALAQEKLDTPPTED